MQKEKLMSRLIIRFFDILLVIIFLPFALIAFIMLLVPQLIYFKGIFYISERTGQNGKKFTYIKLKSMRGNPDELHANPQGGGRAHLETWRIPPWGRFLRKTHLDEIPELFFILTSRESFVGPRPLLSEHIVLVDSPERRALKPGWTGLSQIYLKTRRVLPSRIQRRLDKKLGSELNIRLYAKILCATFFARRKKPGNPGPTVTAYRQSIQTQYGETNENF